MHYRDALTVTADEFDPAPTALVANLPYNVAVPVVLHLLAELPGLRHGLVMVQKEVADRLTAAPGSRVYGVPSVKLAWYAGPARRAGCPPASSGRCPMWSLGWSRSRAGGRPSAQPWTGTRSSPSSTRPSPSGARCCARRWPTWAGGAEAAEEILARAGVAPTARGEELDVGQFAAIAAARPAPGATGKVTL